MKALSQVVRDWQFGAVLRYQSGALIGDPASLNLLTQQLGRVAGRRSRALSATTSGI